MTVLPFTSGAIVVATSSGAPNSRISMYESEVE
jgi:hypothetical protein